MKTLKIMGIILFIVICASQLFNDDSNNQQVLQEYTQEDETISKYGKPAMEKPAPETVYVEVPASPAQYQEQEQPVGWLFPTGVSRKVYRPGSQREREWRQSQERAWQEGDPMSHPERNGNPADQQTGKRYHPDYEIIPVETNQ